MLYFGMKLKQLRKDRNLTQQQLANKLDLTKSTISAYENSSKYPSVEVLINISSLFNISTNFLLGLSDNKEFNLAPLTDDQIKLLNELIEQFTVLNNITDI